MFAGIAILLVFVVGANFLAGRLERRRLLRWKVPTKQAPSEIWTLRAALQENGMIAIRGLIQRAVLIVALSLGLRLWRWPSKRGSHRPGLRLAELPLPLWGARALNTFAAEGLTATVVTPGGDPAALAALDTGDVDLAAVGTETVLRAAAKGQPFEIVYNLMSKVTLEVVVAPSFLEKTGVKPGDPLEKRIAALKGATIGVGAIGGTQETAARWPMAKAGSMDPKPTSRFMQVGGPPALQAALENKRIDAFILSPPEGYLAAKTGAGTVLISLGDRVFLLLANQPYLVLVAKKPMDDKGVRPDRQDRARDAIGQFGAGQGSAKFAAAAITQAVLRQGRSGCHRSRRQDAWQRREPAPVNWTMQSSQRPVMFSKEVGIDFGKDIDAAAS